MSAAATAAATTMLLHSIARGLLPYELRRHVATKFYEYFATKLYDFCATFTKEITITIDEFDGLVKNQLFDSAETYLATIISPSIKRFNALVPEKETKIHISAGEDEDIVDTFRGFQLTWRLVRKETRHRQIPGTDESRATRTTEFKYLELTFPKKYRNQVFDDYLPFILERSKYLKDENKNLKLNMPTIMDQRFKFKSRL